MHMAITDLSPGRQELAELTPAEFVGLIRAECAKPGHGMQDHPIVEAMEAGTVTIPQLRLFTEQFYLHISKMLPWIGAIYVRGLTEETHGNATGIGYADLFPRCVFDQVDLNSTYMNAFTAKRPAVAKIPMLVESELQALQVLLNFRREEDPASLRLAWIRNTSKLERL